MRKKIIMGTCLIWISLFGIFSLSAAKTTDRVEILSNSDSIKQLTTDGANMTNTINTETSNLENGDINIEIALNNYKTTEIIYVVDNIDEIKDYKDSLIDAIKTNATTIETLQNIKQGYVTNLVEDGEEKIKSIELSNNNIEIELENIKTMAPGTQNKLTEAIEIASKSFTEDTTVDNKVLVLFINMTEYLADKSELETLINEIINSGIKIIPYGISLAKIPEGATQIPVEPSLVPTVNMFSDLFENEKFAFVEELDKINFATEISTYLPCPKQYVSSSISFDDFILNNFDIKNVSTNKGTARFDTSTNQVFWEPSELGTNEKIMLTYTLSLKKYVDESIIGKAPLRTNRQIIVDGIGTNGVRFHGTYPEDSKIEDQICSPTIRILRESIDNPKTGVTNYIIFGATLLSVAAVTLVILNSKNQFNRI